MTGFDGVLLALWNMASSLLIHGLLFGTVVLAMILLARRLLRHMPRRAVVWLWLPLLLVMFSPILPGIGIPVPEISRVVSFGETAGEVSDAVFLDPVLSDMSTELLPEDASVHITASEPDVHGTCYPTWQGVVGLMWGVGTIGVFGYHLYRHFRVRQICGSAVRMERRGRIRIYTLSGIRTPFVYGYIRPRIYLPQTPSVDGTSREMILLHEEMHVRRLDVLWRLLWEATLCVYWFQPLLWVSQDLFIADTEGACDEAVLSELGADRTCRADYAQTLLLYAGPRKRGYPTAFGMTEMQGRVQAVLYPAALHTAGIIGLVFAILLTAAVALLSPVGDDESEESAAGAVTSEMKEGVHNAVIRIEPTSALFDFVDGYVEAHTEIWEPTDVTFELPLGWTVMPQTAVFGKLLDETGAECGTYTIMGFSPIDAPDIPPENIPPDEQKWQAIYHDLRLSSMQNVADADYHPIVTEKRFESAVAVMDQAIYEEGVPAAAWEHQRVPLVLAYDQDCSMYLRMTFDARVDSETMKEIAASVTFEKVP